MARARPCLATLCALFALVPLGCGEEAVVLVRVHVPADPDEPLAIELSGAFGPADGRLLQMASGVVGAYLPLSFVDFVRDLEARSEHGPLALERAAAGFRLRGAGELVRVAYRVDTRAAERALTEPLCVTRRSAERATLVGSGLFLVVAGAEARAHEVELDLPAGWRCAWALEQLAPRRFRTRSAFELVDEPALCGPAVATRALDALEPPRFAHVWREDGADPEPALDTLAEALAASARGLAALGIPAHRASYHAYFELFEPRADRKLGWAMEHGRSLHALDASDRLDALTPRLVYHVLHHELHAFLPRRLFTDRLAPRRQLAAEPTRAIWFAEGFAQYLAACALARSGAASVEQALGLLARRFATTWSEQAPSDPRSLSSTSLAISAGDHTYWMWQFAGGALVALWIDLDLRARDGGERGLVDVLVGLASEWPEGIPEERLVEVLSAASGLALGERFARHVDGVEPLPLDLLLERAGIRRAGADFRVLAGDELAPEVRRFRARSFGGEE